MGTTVASGYIFSLSGRKEKAMLFLIMLGNQTISKNMTNTTSIFLFGLHPVKLESGKPTKLHSLPLGNQRLWYEVPLR